MMKIVANRLLLLPALLLVLGVACSEQKTDLAVAEQVKEFTPEPYSPNLDLGVQIPIDLKITLLNQPAQLGDVAELELMFTSRYDQERPVSAEFLMPETAALSGGNIAWNGTLEKNQTQRLRIGALVNTEKPVSIQARVTLDTPNGPISRGTAYVIDLGEKDQATTREQAVEGYEGGNTLNVIVPQNQQ